MPESSTTNDTLSVYRAALTWLVGLSAAAVAGAFLNFDKVSSAPPQVRAVFFIAALAFGLTTCFGVQYFFWLNHIANRLEARTAVRTLQAVEEAKAKDATKSTAEKKTAEEQVANLSTQDAALTAEVKNGWNEVATWHKKTLRAFDVSMGLAGLLLLIGAIAGSPCPKCPAENDKRQIATTPASPPYDIVQSAIHKAHHGNEAHTFLLNKNSGEVWKMVCHANSDEVEFRKVHRIGFDGQFDDPAPATVAERSADSPH